MTVPLAAAQIVFTPLPAAHFGPGHPRRASGSAAAGAQLQPHRCRDRLTDVAFALGAGDTAAGQAGNAESAIGAVTALRDRLGLTRTLAGDGIDGTDYTQIAADDLGGEVLDNTPRMPDAADITAILTVAEG